MKASWLGPNAPKFLTLCISSRSGSQWWFPSPEGGSFSDDVIRSHFSVTFLGQHLSVCFSSRPVVCAVSGSGLLSQGQMWVSFHGGGLNSRERVVTPANLGLVLEYCNPHLSPGVYANQARFCTSLRATHGSSLGTPVLLSLSLSSLPSLIIKDPPHTIQQPLNHSCS